MIRIECPRCGGIAAKAVRRIYCPVCGWNRDSAEQRLRSELGQAPRVLAFLAATPILSLLVFGFTWIGLSIVVMFVLFTFLVAMEYGRLREALQQVLAQAPRSPQRKPAGKTQERMLSEQRRLTEHNEYVRYLQRPPRRLRMSRDLRFLVAIFFLPMGVAVVGFMIHFMITPDYAADWMDYVFLSLPVGMAIAGMVMLARKRGERRLAARGEAATGWVTKLTEAVGGGQLKHNEIGYEFKDATGRVREGRSIDATDSIRAGMLVVVFYDPEDLHNSMAMGGGSYEVVPRSKRSQGLGARF